MKKQNTKLEKGKVYNVCYNKIKQTPTKLLSFSQIENFEIKS